MEKLPPPNIFVLKKDEQSSLVIKACDFYEILVQAVIQKPGVYALNIPETIIKGFGLKTSFLLHIDNGVLDFSSQLSQHTLRKFYKRCSFFKLENCPLCICKNLNQKNEEKCFIANTISECENLWKKNESIIIQRYLSTGPEVIFKARITYSITRDQFQGKLVWKDKDKTFKLIKDEECNEEDISVNEYLSDQMKTLKEILQITSFKAEVVEIVADFVQNIEGNWFFIQLVSARFERLRKKIITKKKPESEIEEQIQITSESHRDELKEQALKDLELMISAPKKKNKKKKEMNSFF
ncbi:hypothetical protein SteCoe_31975 [Stentor coeruleus]|uniref:Uncharacterized protein n=1 Tax=Stentor coeruleus TaxID=5963 RepID=A0A1R2B024_9CILI|nr:hypothetical protein SteCoe_31975 [Stentor coeruleus]